MQDVSGVRHIEISTAGRSLFEVGFSVEKLMRCESPGVLSNFCTTDSSRRKTCHC